jgi:glyoxylase-like metal-dependent hydrolase (beta-lactamase superfamily II)
MKYRSLAITIFNDSFFLCQPSIGANIGLFIKNNQALVIDSGYYPDISYDIIAFLDNVLEAKPVLLFNTHYHSDHTFGNQVFTCPVLSSELCRDKMIEGPLSFWSDSEIAQAKTENPDLVKWWKDLQITPPTMTYTGKYEYDFEGEKILFQQLGGHTPDSSIVYFPDHRIIYAGDLVFESHYPTLLRDGDPFELVDALRTIRAMHVEKIAPGHGNVCEDDTIDRLVEYWRGLILKCGLAIDSDLDDMAVINELMPDCRIRNIEFHEFKHRRNIESVMYYMRNNPRRSFNLPLDNNA